MTDKMFMAILVMAGVACLALFFIHRAWTYRKGCSKPRLRSRQWIAPRIRSLLNGRVIRKRMRHALSMLRARDSCRIAGLKSGRSITSSFVRSSMSWVPVICRLRTIWIGFFKNTWKRIGSISIVSAVSMKRIQCRNNRRHESCNSRCSDPAGIVLRVLGGSVLEAYHLRC